jgi:hypothetical protein
MCLFHFVPTILLALILIDVENDPSNIDSVHVTHKRPMAHTTHTWENIEIGTPTVEILVTIDVETRLEL